MPWLFRKDGADLSVLPESAVRFSGDVLGCVGFARQGGGLFQIYDFIANSSVYQPDLVEVLTAYKGRARPFCILYPHNRYLSAKVRAFVDYMTASIGSLSTRGKSSGERLGGIPSPASAARH